MAKHFEHYLICNDCHVRFSMEPRWTGSKPRWIMAPYNSIPKDIRLALELAEVKGTWTASSGYYILCVSCAVKWGLEQRSGHCLRRHHVLFHEWGIK